MSKIAKGWNRGLREGLEGSGFVLGAVVPIAVAITLFVVLVSIGAWFNGCFRGPGTCTNYSYKMGLLDSNEASCTRWPAMEMRVENRWVKADTVHCTCTAGSFPPAKK